MKTVAAYIRVSTEDQIEFSPDSQMKALKNYASKNDMILPNDYIFVDEGISGKTTIKRPSFNKMIATAKMKPKPFDAILVWKYSRFARNREDSVVYKSMLRKELGIDVISISEDVGDDKMSVIFEAMIEAMDEYYSINLAEEVKRGMTEKAKRGGILSIPPFGYTIKDGIFVPVPEEAIIIKKVFNDYIQGKGFLKIAKELNALNIKTHRGNSIENRTVEYWLNNPTYIGKIRWNPNGATSRNYYDKNLILSDGKHESIIDIETWDAVQEKIKQQKEKFRKFFTSPRNELSHWCVGIARCGICGATLSNAGGYLACSRKSKGLCKGNGSISTSQLSKIIIESIENILSGSDVKIEAAPLGKINFPKEDKDIEIVQSEIKKAELRLARVKKAYEDGIDTIEEYKDNKTKIQNEIILLKTKLTDLHKNNENTSKGQVSNTSILRLVQILKDDKIRNTKKNELARMLLKEVIKTGENGKTIKLIFWE